MKESSPLDSTFLSLQIILIIRATPQIPSLPSKLLVSRKSTRFYRRKQPRGIIILEPFFAKISSATARSYHSERRGGSLLLPPDTASTDSTWVPSPRTGICHYVHATRFFLLKVAGILSRTVPPTSSQASMKQVVVQ